MAPVQAKADQRSVDEVLDGLVEGKRDKVIAEQATDLADFGLKEPSLIVEAAVKDVVTPTVLHVGLDFVRAALVSSEPLSSAG